MTHSSQCQPSHRWLTLTILSISLLTVMAGAAVAPALGTVRAYFADTESILIRVIGIGRSRHAVLFCEVVIGAKEVAQFGEQLLRLLQDVKIEQCGLLGECGTVGRQAVEMLLAQGGEAEFERLNVL